MSAMLCELTTLALEQTDDEAELEIDDETGLPVLRIGQTITSDDVNAFLSENE